jgi:predicted RNA-binding Zn ribbon-like protein
MRVAVQEPGEWIEGFLFVANRPILDFLNTKPLLAQGPTELLNDFGALERWLIVSGIVNSAKTRSLLRRWRHSLEAASFLKDLVAFRERLRNAVLRIESGFALPDEFLQEINAGILRHPRARVLRKREGKIVREPHFDPQRPEDLWAPFFEGTADLLSESESNRIRKCESCVVHFFDTSKKGSRRWCSMNICGNKLKVAAYQRRKRGHVPPADALQRG